MTQITNTKMNPGDKLNLASENASFKLVLRISDGTEISVDMGPGSQIDVKVGNSSIEAIIKDPDRPTGHLEVMPNEPPSDD